MLKSLEIKDYALIDHINVQFEKGLNIITGETGAGKSILIDAMSLLLGERASVDVIRKGAQKSFVEGIFDVEKNKKVKLLLDQNNLESQTELIVRREISLKGLNRCFINDTPVTLIVIKELGNLLVDLHGQHEHQSLLNKDTHLEFLDEYSDTSFLISEYQSLYNHLISLLNQLTDLKLKEASIKEKKEIYAYQIREIDNVNPQPDEDKALLDELNVLENSERLLELTEIVYNKLYDGEPSVIDLLGEVKQALNQLQGIDKSFLESVIECDTASSAVKELASVIRIYKSKIDLDNAEVETKRERLGTINLLIKKYGGSVNRIIEHRNKIGEEYDLADNFSAKINELENEINKVRKSAGDAAQKISTIRKKQTAKIEAEVKKILGTFGIPDSVFKVKIEQIESEKDQENYLVVRDKKYLCADNGIDRVEFYISTNPGEDLKPLTKVASGGEVSRIMLSLKTILARNDKLPLLIFDEIDTGISGKIAQKVGIALKELAAFHQIIAITHLPQIAGMADQHFSVQKNIIDNRAVSSIKKLSSKERIEEIAKLLSGEELSKSSLESAKLLISNK